jgi:hypothetical protein
MHRIETTHKGERRTVLKYSSKEQETFKDNEWVRWGYISVAVVLRAIDAAEVVGI